MKLTYVASRLAIAMVLSGGLAAAARAQPAPPPASVDDGFAEIIVTAQKRSQSLQDVPAAVQALSSETLDQINAVSLRDIVGKMPGVNGVSGGDGETQFNIRGVQSIASGELTTSTVGYYVDETPVTASTGAPDVALFDLERVEVLRGPQGTLYGEGALGGAVRLITTKPNAGQLEGRALGEFSSTSSGEPGYQLGGVINVPLARDMLALRLTGTYVDRGGYLDNVQTGVDDENDRQTLNLRAALRFSPGSDADFDLSYMRQDFRGEGERAANALAGRRAYLAAFRAATNDESDLVNGTLNYDFGGADLVSSTSYFKRSRQEVGDARELYDLIEGAFGFTPPNGITENLLVKERTFTQEIRLSSPSANRLRWLVGGWYKNRRLDFDVTEALPEAIPLLPPEGIFFDRSAFQRFKESALFGELSYDISPAFTVTGGARWFDNRFSGVRTLQQAGEALPDASARIRSRDVLFKLSADYDINDDVMVYALFSQGVRGGGLNVIGALPSPEPGYAPDRTNNYELGIKSQWLDRRLRLNVAAYQIDWEDIQTSVLLSAGNSFTTNGGSATSRGLEVEADLSVSRSFQLGGSMTLARARTDERFDLVGFDTPAADDDIFAESGARLPFVAGFKSNLYLSYTVPISGSLAATMRADWEHVGRRPNSLRTNGDLNSSGYLVFDAYDTIDLRAGIAGDHWSLDLFARNLANTRAELSGAYPTIDGIVINDPRTIGLVARYAF